jgi:WD40 repeat protein
MPLPKKFHDRPTKYEEAVRMTRSALYGWIVLVMISLAAVGSPTPTEPNLRAIQEFRKNNLGMADVSADGKLLLFETHVKTTSTKRTFRVYAVRADNYREISSIEVERARDESYSADMFFIPGYHQVVLAGRTKRSTSRNSNELVLWTPETDTVVQIPGVLNHQTFVVEAWDSDRLLCYTAMKNPNAPEERRFFLYSLSSRKAEPIGLRGDEVRLEWDRPVVFSPDRKTVPFRVKNTESRLEIHNVGGSLLWSIETPPMEIANYAFSPDGRFLVVISVQPAIVVGTENGMRTRADIPFLSVFDTSLHRQVERFQILKEVVPFLKKTHRFATAENYPKNSGSRLQFSNNGRWLAIGFEVAFDDTGKQSAQFALFRFPSLELAGFAQHPAIKLGDFRHVGATAVMSRLRFQLTTGFFSRQVSTLLPGMCRTRLAGVEKPRGA